jgi:hypothetical protein
MKKAKDRDPVKRAIDKSRKGCQPAGKNGYPSPPPEPPENPGDAYEGPLPVPKEAPALALDTWPAPPDEAAFHGLAGEVVKTIEPETESDPVAILVQFLVAFGNACKRGAYYQVEARRHYTNLFAILVGKTAKGRKGTAWGWNESLFPEEVSPGWHRCQQTGLSSGEGLIWAVHDEVRKKEAIKQKGRVVGYQEVITDEGVADKRLLVVEEEFASVLRQAVREGNTLSPVLRHAWDCGKLRCLTKNSPARATDAHVSLIGHITQLELLKNLSETDSANGFANRFLWVCVKRSKLLPDGGETVNLLPLQERVRAALLQAELVGRMVRDEEASRLWRQVYPDLSRERPGLLGLVTNRAEAQALRLSNLYALLDGSGLIRAEHLRAALALWDYAERSCAWIFGESTGNRDADELLEALRAAGDKGMSLTQMSRFFGNHKPASHLRKALAVLTEGGLVRPGRAAAGRLPAENWRAAPQSAKAANPANPIG